MKNLIILLIIIISTSTTLKSQGFIVNHIDQLKTYCSENGFEEGTKLTKKFEDGSFMDYYKCESEDLIWYWYLNDKDYVQFSIVNFKNSHILSAFLVQINNAGFVKMSPKLWLNYLDWGVVSIEFSPETETTYPNIVYTYELY